MSISRTEDYIALKNICQGLKDYLAKRLSPVRFTHSLEVAKLAQRLCLCYNLRPLKGYLAGLAHDLAREWPEERLIAFLKHKKLGIKKWEKDHPVLLHGRVAACYLEEAFGVRDRDVLEAVKLHVTGHPRMGCLSQIIYVADYLEPGRGFLDEEKRLWLLSLDLSEMVLIVTKNIIAFLTKTGRKVAPVTYRLIKEFEEGLSEKGYARAKL